jgi:uncharacterized protein YvpB
MIKQMALIPGFCLLLAGILLWGMPVPAGMPEARLPLSPEQTRPAPPATPTAQPTPERLTPEPTLGVPSVAAYGDPEQGFEQIHPTLPAANPGAQAALPAGQMAPRYFISFTSKQNPAAPPKGTFQALNTLTPAPLAPAAPVSLAMERFFHSQRTETRLANACGPASLLIALDYFGVQAGNLDQVIQAMRLPQASGGFDTHCSANPVCLSPGVLAQVARQKYKLKVDAHANWSFEQLYQSLVDGRPVIADVTWGLAVGGFGHFVIVYGVDPVKKIVYYHDPLDGPARSASWKNFSASWNGPVDVGDPLQPAGHHAWGMALAK